MESLFRKPMTGIGGCSSRAAGERGGGRKCVCVCVCVCEGGREQRIVDCMLEGINEC